jgi:hypothetical protein
MLRKISLRAKRDHLRALSMAGFLVGSLHSAFAQEPPVEVPKTAPLTAAADTLVVNDWSLFPTIRLGTLYSDNLFQSPVAPISTAALGVWPSMVAEWTNGIHTTTLYGDIERLFFPTQGELNTFDRRAGFAQKYWPVPDLIFQVQGDYTHKTYALDLTSSIPDSLVSPEATALPNGNTVLPNGAIVGPNGAVLGQTNPALFFVGQSIINPHDQFTASISVDKYLDRGIVRLNSSISRTNYQNQSTSTPDFTVRTVGGEGGRWLNPMLYVYSEGDFAATSDVTMNATAYRALAGFGLHPNNIVNGSVYYGRQGSDIQGSGAAGGDIFGAKASYMPSPDWTFQLMLDHTTNISSETSATFLALALPVQSVVQIPLSDSVHVNSLQLQADHIISQQWTASGRFDYIRYDFIASPRLDNVWAAGVALQYSVWKNLTLSWQYQFSRVNSNIPLTSSSRNFGLMDATYRF